MRKQKLSLTTTCKLCGFTLYEPIAANRHSKLALYNDNRFPGRSILAFHNHFESLEELHPDDLTGFFLTVQYAMGAIREATKATRVNVSILGNRERHLHAHLIPRFPAKETYPDRSPWDDPRPKGLLTDKEVNRLKRKILKRLPAISGFSPLQ